MHGFDHFSVTRQTDRPRTKRLVSMVLQTFAAGQPVDHGLRTLIAALPHVPCLYRVFALNGYAAIENGDPRIMLKLHAPHD
jgi:hypothetical protein